MPDRLAVRGAQDHVGRAPGGDHHVGAGAAGDVGGLELGGHPAHPQAADAAAGDRAQRLVDRVAPRGSAGRRDRVRGSAVKSPGWSVSSSSRSASASNATSADRLSLSPTLISAVATASFSLMIGMMPCSSSACEHVARVQEAVAVGHVGAGQQHLPDVEAVDLEQALPDLHQPALAHGGQHLLGRHGGRQRRDGRAARARPRWRRR